MSYLAPEIRIYEGNPTRKKLYFIPENAIFNGRPPSKCDWASFGLVLRSNWVRFVVKTWQPWFGLISSVASNSNKFCSVRPGSIDPMTAVVQRVKGFAYYSLSFSRHNKNIKIEGFFLYILSRYFI